MKDAKKTIIQEKYTDEKNVYPGQGNPPGGYH